MIFFSFSILYMSCNNFVINSTNVVGNYNNTYVFQFPNGSYTIPENSEMSISQITLPYSFRNITSTLGNNLFYYTIPCPSVALNSASTISTSGVLSDSTSGLQIGSVISIPNASPSFTASNSANLFYIISGSSGAWQLNQSPSATTTIGATATSNQNIFKVSLSDGFYTITDLNNALNTTMKSNGHYWYSAQAQYQSQFQFSGTISGTTLTIASATSPTTQLYIGSVITGYNIANNTIISAQTGPYTYTISVSQTISTATPMTASTNNEITPQIIYPLSLQVNSVLYTNQLTSITIPIATQIASVLGLNFFQANGLNGQATWNGVYPTSANTAPQIIFPYTSAGVSQTSTSNLLGNVVGFQSGSYPSTYTSITALSTNVNGNTLQATPPYPALGSNVNGVIVRCNLVSNKINPYEDTLDSFAINTTYGSNINYLPISDNRVKIRAGTYPNITITLSDQNYNPLICLDSNVLMSFIIYFNEKK